MHDDIINTDLVIT